MSKEGKMDCGRRRLIVATAAVGGAGAAAALVPFVSSMLPSERAKAAGAPVEVDVSSLAPGQMITVEWRGKPVWILNRTQDMLDTQSPTILEAGSDLPWEKARAGGAELALSDEDLPEETKKRAIREQQEIRI